ncbi:MAG: hypothetical protein WAN87_10525 [Thermoplasmata archaeon]
MTARRFELLERMATEAVLEQHPSIARPRARLERKIVSFRPLWKGRRTARAAVQERIRKSDDREERRAAWYAEDPLHQSIEEPLKALVRLRNERARRPGYRSYPECRLAWEGLTIARLEELLEAASRHVSTAAREKRDEFQDATGLNNWFPWDASYGDDIAAPLPESSFTGLEMLPSVLEGVREWGFGPGALKFRVDHHDLPMGGIEVSVNPPRDVRIVVHATAGWMHYMILFHEVGHAVHSRSVRSYSPLAEEAPGFAGFLEGVGTLFEEIPRSPEWLATRPGVDSDRATQFARVRQVSEIFRLAGRISGIRGEIALYRNSDKDVVLARYGALRQLGGFDAFDPPSFASSSYVDHPVYSQSYLFAMLFAKQLLESMHEEMGVPCWPNRRFGPWLTENWFRSSGEFDWVPHLRVVTGRPFGAAAFNRWARTTIADLRRS